jgi:hypothetical protein
MLGSPRSLSRVGMPQRRVQAHAAWPLTSRFRWRSAMLDGIGGWLLGKGGESVAQGCSSRDAKLGKDSVQVTADCPG